MPIIQLNPNVTTNVDEILNGIAQLEKSDLELFLKKVAILVAKRKAPSLSQEETKLFMVINKTFPKKLETRYQELSQKMNFGKISEKEHQDLLKIVKKKEQQDVERLGALIKLSQIREVTLDELMDELGIKPTHVN